MSERNSDRRGRAAPALAWNRSQSGDRLAERCAAQILDGVCRGDLKPGRRLGEISLAKKFRVGQAQVRAAFDRLAYAGILDRRSRSGTYVRELSVEQWVEMTQVRALLEGFACRLACRLAGEADLMELEKLARDFDDRIERLAPGQYRQLESLDFEFHRKIVEISSNAALKRMLDEQHLIQKCLRRGFDLPGLFAAPRDDAPNHLEIVQSLRSRRPADAQRCMRRHLTNCLIAELRLSEELELI